MYPVIHIFGRPVLSYYVCAVSAGVLGMLLCMLGYRKHKLGIWKYFLPVLTVIFALIGARGLNIVLNPSAFGKAFPPYALRYGKLSLMGGLAFGLIPTAFVSLIKKIPLPKLLDDLVVPAGSGIIILKTGCFLNGCCFGRHTNSIFGMVFPANSMKYAILDKFGLISRRVHRVHPAQLYEIAGVVLTLLLVFLIGKLLRLMPGGRFGLFVFLFSAVRLAILPIRVFPYPKITVRLW